MARTRSQKRAAKASKRSPAHTLYDRFREDATAAPREPAEDPRVTVMAARCRHNAQADPDKVTDAMWGDLAGRAIAIGGGTDAAALWGTFKRLDAADERYFRRIIGRARFPHITRMEQLPEPFGTRADDAPSRYLTEDDKDRAAVSEWMRWQGYLGYLSATEHHAIVSAMRQRVMLSHAGRLTGAGAAFVNGMRALDRMAKGR